MPLIDLRPSQFRRLLRRRREMGGDRYDEVWDGVYVMSPIANNEHQHLIYLLATTFGESLRDIDGAIVLPGTNVSDRDDDWTQNYRVPDVAVFLPGNPAEDRDTHWLGGPDLAVEIVSRGDRSRQKLDFYAKVGVRELMIVDRRPWSLELHRRDGDGWTLAGKSAPDVAEAVASSVLPLQFRLLPAQPRPRIEVLHADGTPHRLL